MFELFTATLIDGVFAAVAGLGFAYASSPPKRTLAFCALLAAFAHASRFWIMQMGLLNISVATLIVSFLSGIFGYALRQTAQSASRDHRISRAFADGARSLCV